jgi:hypothetical protein
MNQDRSIRDAFAGACYSLGVQRFVRTVLALAAVVAAAQDSEPLARFGTTVVIPTGLEGRIYHLRHWSKTLPNFSKLRPVGTIYTSSLNIPTQDFDHGFPGVTTRAEWFAIDYRGRFWVEKPGRYEFSLLSDDGSKLYIDGQEAINNDGWHPPEEKRAHVDLTAGIHRIRVSYFQGPKFQVALLLKIAGAGESERVFSTEEFKPPADPANWRDEPEPPSSDPAKRK